jgi:hypothetical protein
MIEKHEAISALAHHRADRELVERVTIELLPDGLTIENTDRMVRS